MDNYVKINYPDNMGYYEDRKKTYLDSVYLLE